MRTRRFLIGSAQALALLLLSLVMLNAVQAEQGGQDPIEAQAKRLEQQLIAPCCWSKTVADEYSKEAYAIRDRIRSMLRSGKSAAEVRQAFVAEYGVRILAEPPAEGFHLLAWFAPLIVLVFGGWFALRSLRTSIRSARQLNETKSTSGVKPIEQQAEGSSEALSQALKKEYDDYDDIV